MRARIAALVCSLLLVVTAGCTDSTGVDERGVHGTYTLQTINGTGLPFVVRNDATEKFEVMMGEITLKLDGTFTDEMGYRITQAGGTPEPISETLTGNFFQELGSIYFEVDGGGVYDMTVGDNALMMSLGDYQLVYER